MKISLAGLLGIVFIILKLTEIIAWSWWWVLAPFWIPVCIGIIIAILAEIFPTVKLWLWLIMKEMKGK